jgi:hypothetical protein
MAASAEEIAGLVVGKRKIGKAVAERLCGLLHYSESVPASAQVEEPEDK